MIFTGYLSLPSTGQGLTQGQRPESRLKWGFRGRSGTIRGSIPAGLWCSSPTRRWYSLNRGLYGLKSAFVGLCPYHREGFLEVLKIIPWRIRFCYIFIAVRMDAIFFDKQKKVKYCEMFFVSNRYFSLKKDAREFLLILIIFFFLH